MNEGLWLETCARRLRELDPSLNADQANQVALRLLLGRQWPVEYRAMHPVAAAEGWHTKFGEEWPMGGGIAPNLQGAAMHH